MDLGGLSGEACIERLVALGFVVFHKGTGVTMLARDKRRVLVPHISVLGPEMIEGIVRSAGITRAELSGVRHKSGFVRKQTASTPDSEGGASSG